jgi:hypothetical protein
MTLATILTDSILLVLVSTNLGLSEVCEAHLKTRVERYVNNPQTFLSGQENISLL